MAAQVRHSILILGLLALPLSMALKIDRPPNFVMLFADDLGYGDTGFTGHPTTSTPNLDRLAWGGKVLTTWYSGCPVCSGSRAALMTGRQFPRTGVPGVLMDSESHGLPLNETTLAEHLKKANYATAIVGKWHLGQRQVYLPGNRGFDQYLGIPFSDDMGLARTTKCSNSGGDHSMAQASENATDVSADADIDMNRFVDDMWNRKAYEASGYLSPIELQQPWLGDSRMLPLVEQVHGKTQVLEQPLDFTHLAEKYEKFATDFIHDHKEKPFFLYLPFSHVHTTAANMHEKQYAGCDFKNSTRRGTFGDALAELDWIVGKVHEALKENDLEEETLILFTSDNGPWMEQGLSGGSTGLLNGRFSGYWNTGKGSTWEGGIRAPAFAHWKGRIDPFSRSGEVVSSMDVFPTLAELAGIPLPTDRVYDGRSMVSVLLEPGGRSKHDFLFFYGGCNGVGVASAVRHGKWKAHFCTGPGLDGCSGCPIKQYKDVPLLFNIERDPSEAEPVNPTGGQPEDPEAQAAIQRIQQAYATERATFRPGNPKPEPDGPGEGPGRYNICCDRSKQCDCDGPPDNAGGSGGAGLLQMGSRAHHDAHHGALGREPPLPATALQEELFA